MDGLVEPAWISGADGAPVWGNAAYLRVVGVGTAADAARDNKSLDRAADALAIEAAKAGELRELVRWVPLDGRRRALRFSAQPLDGGGVGVFSSDVTEVEDMAGPDDDDTAVQIAGTRFTQRHRPPVRAKMTIASPFCKPTGLGLEGRS